MSGFLFGTIHAGVDAHRDLPSPVWRAFQQSPCVVLESDQTKIEPGALRSMATLPRGGTLREKLRPEVYAKLEKVLVGKLPPSYLLHAQPWFAAIAYMQQQLPPSEPMDQVFARQGQAAHKKLFFLETWDEALKAFASVTKAEDLTELVQNSSNLRNQTRDLVSAYKTGDEGQINQTMTSINQDTFHAEQKLDVLIAGRNRLWLPRLKKILANNRCFVAVGAGHLLGQGSLIENLKSSGWQIERTKD